MAEKDRDIGKGLEIVFLGLWLIVSKKEEAAKVICRLLYYPAWFVCRCCYMALLARVGERISKFLMLISSRRRSAA